MLYAICEGERRTGFARIADGVDAEMTYRLLDLFCGAGGCTAGYQRAGFHVTGVDNRPQPRYCGDVFVQADALEYVAAHGREFDVIHASPPCQRYSKTQIIQGNDHPDLIGPLRALLVEIGRPYVIENVVGAPLIDPVMIAGTMFGLRTVRERLFESNVPLPFAMIPPPNAPHAKMGRLAKAGEYHHIAGKGGRSGLKQQWQDAMGIDWMTIMELAQAIPPAYTEWIGKHLYRELEARLRS